MGGEDDELQIQASASCDVPRYTIENDDDLVLDKSSEGLQGVTMDVIYCGKPESVDNMQIHSQQDNSNSSDSDEEDMASGLGAELEGELSRSCKTDTSNPMGIGNFAMPLHYFMSGALQSIFNGVLYASLMGTMGVKGHVYLTATITVNMPWCMKIVFGFISDWFPIMGYRRKYYCMIGWVLVSVVSVMFACLFTEPTPYYCFSEDGGYNESRVCNPDARLLSGWVVLSMACNMLGLTIAESAADGLLVECCQRKQETTRHGGTLQVDCFIIRIFGMASGSCLLAFLFNSKRHLGFFSWDLGLNSIALGVSGIAVAMVFIWWMLSSADQMQALRVPCCASFASHQEIVATSPCSDWNHNTSFTRCQVAKDMFMQLLRLASTPKFLMFFVYQLLAPTISAMIPPTTDMIRRYWAGVQQLQQQLSEIATLLFYLCVLMVVRKVCIDKNWRALVTLSVVTSSIVGTSVCTLTATDVVRNQYFFLSGGLFESLPMACNFLVSTLASIQLAPKGHEATIYGLTATMHALAPSIARALSNWLYGFIPITVTGDGDSFGILSDPSEYIEDSTSFRFVVVTAILLNNVITLCSLLALPLLPKNGAHIRSMNSPIQNTPKKCTAWFTCATCGSVSLLSFVLVFMAISPGSSCLKIVGGEGC